jgi:hypothetical protein
MFFNFHIRTPDLDCSYTLKVILFTSMTDKIVGMLSHDYEIFDIFHWFGFHVGPFGLYHI